MNSIYRNCLILIVFISSAVNADVINRTEFLNFNLGELKQWNGWEYSTDITGYNTEGWLLDNDDILGLRDSYTWGNGARSFNKTDYGIKNSAIIDTSFKAPLSQGGSFKVYEDNNSDASDNRSSWWIWYDGKPLSERGITDSNTNRMSFYLYISGMDEIGSEGKVDSVDINFHVGTYLCWYGSGTAYGTGDGCPYEGVGNQHYYHYFSFNPGAWLHVLMDQHPTHLRGEAGSSSLPNNPSFVSDGKNYFEQLNQFYMEIRNDNQNQTAYWLDEINFYQESEAQNEDSVTSLWLGYWASGNYFEVGFQDDSFASYDDTTFSSFEVRWSDKPITNANYLNANLVDPIFYAGSEHSGSAHIFRRPNSYYKSAWTRFTIPSTTIETLSEIYVAIKDVSSLNNNTGTAYPWNRGDGHNAPTNLIKTIDLKLTNAVQSPAPAQPSSPTNLKIQ